MCIKQFKNDNLINFVYNEFSSRYKEPNYLINRAILCPLNKSADLINMEVLNKLPTEEKHYYSSDSPRNDNQAFLYPTDFLNEYNCSGFPPHHLILKENAIVILLRNLNPSEGLCNGTRLIVKKFRPHVIEAEIVSNKNCGARVFIPRISLYSNEDDTALQFIRKQFPIKLAFGLSINKSQGQTIKKVGLLVDTHLFSHGHLYTAMSRVNHIDNFKVMVKALKYDNSEGYFIDNVVYKEILNK
jgi:ATP-dependent DNA helicase PIF1